ncbi:MAG: hypothetical protein HOO06_13515 [Bdellovibrionaceae bacterium]|nr:hypothetical protein [Pseudobdellovibrionaceae bacterium]
MKLILIVFCSILLIQCAQKPTEVYEKSEYKDKVQSLIVLGARSPLKITEDTVVLDARSNFSYSVSHIPNSINLQWKEFSGGKKNKLRSDFDEMTKRLARLGISINTPVIVVDKGLFGKGEAGRLAWTLYYLGVENIQVASIQALKTRMTIKESLPKKMLPFWKSQVRDYILITQKDFFKKTDVQSKNTVVIDVRSDNEYAQATNNQSMHVEWTEFFTQLGRPNFNVVNKLKSVGIHKDKEVILVSSKGVRSAAVAISLISLGYKDVKSLEAY